jgi:predicted deacetylase
MATIGKMQGAQELLGKVNRPFQVLMLTGLLLTAMFAPPVWLCSTVPWQAGEVGLS